MAVLPFNSFNLDLSISMPGFAPSPSPSRPFVRAELDMNRLPMAAASVGEESCNINGCYKPRKKLRLSKHQYRLLEDSFIINPTLNHNQKEALAMDLKLKARQVEVWFQNRRARSKLKQTEKECEYLKRWFRLLTDRNRQLQRELEELKTVKVVSPSTVVTITHGGQPPLSRSSSTITMCPQCISMTVATRSSSKAAAIEIATAATAASTTVILSAHELRQQQESQK